MRVAQSYWGGVARGWAWVRNVLFRPSEITAREKVVQFERRLNALPGSSMVPLAASTGDDLPSASVLSKSLDNALYHLHVILSDLGYRVTTDISTAATDVAVLSFTFATSVASPVIYIRLATDVPAALSSDGTARLTVTSDGMRRLTWSGRQLSWPFVPEMGRMFSTQGVGSPTRHVVQQVTSRYGPWLITGLFPMGLEDHLADFVAEPVPAVQPYNPVFVPSSPSSSGFIPGMGLVRRVSGGKDVVSFFDTDGTVHYTISTARVASAYSRAMSLNTHAEIARKVPTVAVLLAQHEQARELEPFLVVWAVKHGAIPRLALPSQFQLDGVATFTPTYTAIYASGDDETLLPRRSNIIQIGHPIAPLAMVPERTASNMLASITGRVQATPNPAVPRAETLRLTEEFVYAVVDIITEKGTVPVVPLDHDEVIRHLDRPSQKVAVKDELDHWRLDYPGTAREQGFAQFKSFLKGETYSAAKPPRCIQTISYGHNVALLSFVLPTIVAMKKHLDWYAFRAPSEVSSAVQALSRAAAECPGAMKADVDLNNCDASGSAWTEGLEEAFLVCLFARSSASDAESVRRLLHSSDNNVARMGPWRYSIGIGKTASGEGDTSLRNTLLTACVTYIAKRLSGLGHEQAMQHLGLFGGDDSLVLLGSRFVQDFALLSSVYSEIGYSIRAEVSTPSDPTRFLGRVYPHPLASPANFCDITRRLGNLSVVLCSESAQVAEAAVSRARGWLITDSHTPLVGAVARCTLRHFGASLEGPLDPDHLPWFARLAFESGDDLAFPTPTSDDISAILAIFITDIEAKYGSYVSVSDFQDLDAHYEKASSLWSVPPAVLVPGIPPVPKIPVLIGGELLQFPPGVDLSPRPEQEKDRYIVPVLSWPTFWRKDLPTLGVSNAARRVVLHPLRRNPNVVYEMGPDGKFLESVPSGWTFIPGRGRAVASSFLFTPTKGEASSAPSSVAAPLPSPVSGALVSVVETSAGGASSAASVAAAAPPPLAAGPSNSGFRRYDKDGVPLYWPLPEDDAPSARERPKRQKPKTPSA